MLIDISIYLVILFILRFCALWDNFVVNLMFLESLLNMSLEKKKSDEVLS